MGIYFIPLSLNVQSMLLKMKQNSFRGENIRVRGHGGELGNCVFWTERICTNRFLIVVDVNKRSEQNQAVPYNSLDNESSQGASSRHEVTGSSQMPEEPHLSLRIVSAVVCKRHSKQSRTHIHMYI